MTLLLDTHTILWWLTDDPQLSDPAREAISDAASTVFLSAASVWEITIKTNLGKLRMPSNWIENVLAGQLMPLPISLEHAVAAGALPPLHRDPFDRMLIAQAIALGLTIVTRDRNIARYDVPVLRA